MDAIADSVERRSMKAYDNRIYHDPQKEPFYDPEWEEAERADEKPQYYIQNTKSGIIIREYKPAVAKLVTQRTDIILTPLKGE